MKADGLDIRLVTPDDIAALVPMIHRVLRVSNTPDYGVANVERVVSHFTEAGVAEMIERNHTLLALQDAKIVGTASLGTSVTLSEVAIRTFFVDPDVQRCGIGSALLEQIEGKARENGMTRLPVRSSLAGEPFYAAHGYVAVQDIWDGDERTIQMEKVLTKK